MLHIITHPVMILILSLFILVIISPTIFKNSKVSDKPDDIRYDD
jgi:hypothetical protein